MNHISSILSTLAGLLRVLCNNNNNNTCKRNIIVKVSLSQVVDDLGCETSRLPDFLDSRLRDGCGNASLMCLPPFTPGRILVLISVIRWFYSRATELLEGLGQLKIQWHRDSNQRPSGFLAFSASTETGDTRQKTQASCPYGGIHVLKTSHRHKTGQLNIKRPGSPEGR
jgi:hypothetical protein